MRVRLTLIVRLPKPTFNFQSILMAWPIGHSNRAFFDHMLELFAKHAVIDLKVRANDLHVDQHHTVEDTGICLGQAVKKLWVTRSIRR